MWNAPRVADREGWRERGGGGGERSDSTQSATEGGSGLPRVTARFSTRVVRLSTPDVERTQSR